jgi:hypothetical protein
MKVLLAFCLMFLATCLPLTGLAQTTDFTYQGQLTDSGAQQPTYQMRFRLFGAAVGGSPIGSPVENTSVAVDGGVFTVALNFGSAVFTGADRYLEIAVRRNAGESYTVLDPRQKLTSSPYAIRTLSAQTADVAVNAQNLGGVPANQYVTTSSNAFIRNGTTLQDADFNIDGNGFIGGNLGVGNTTPGARLVVSADTTSAANNTAYFEATSIGPNASNIHYGTTGDWYIRSASAGGKVVLQDTGGNVGIGTVSPNAKLSLIGNATQDLNSRGFPKAMVLVLANGTISRCYNGIIGSTTAGCGFAAFYAGGGIYSIDFGPGFDVSQAFVSLSTHGNSQNINGRIASASATSVVVSTTQAYEADPTSDGIESDFFLFVY